VDGRLAAALTAAANGKGSVLWYIVLFCWANSMLWSM